MIKATYRREHLLGMVTHRERNPSLWGKGLWQQVSRNSVGAAGESSHAGPQTGNRDHTVDGRKLLNSQSFLHPKLSCDTLPPTRLHLLILPKQLYWLGVKFLSIWAIVTPNHHQCKEYTLCDPYRNTGI